MNTTTEPTITLYKEIKYQLEEDAQLEFRLIESDDSNLQTSILTLTLTPGLGFYPTIISFGNIDSEQLEKISDIFHKLARSYKDRTEIK